MLEALSTQIIHFPLQTRLWPNFSCCCLRHQSRVYAVAGMLAFGAVATCSKLNQGGLFKFCFNWIVQQAVACSMWLTRVPGTAGIYQPLYGGEMIRSES